MLSEMKFSIFRIIEKNVSEAETELDKIINNLRTSSSEVLRKILLIYEIALRLDRLTDLGFIKFDNFNYSVTFLRETIYYDYGKRLLNEITNFLSSVTSMKGE